MDYCRILGIPQGADEEQIKQAYRRKAKQYHPDRNSGDPDAETRFKEVVEAYETLGDSDKRRAHDRKQEKKRDTDTPQKEPVQGQRAVQQLGLWILRIWPGTWRDISDLLI